MSDLVEDLRTVRGLYVREDYAENVKKLFRRHIEQLEPSAQIEDTLYFNHSAIPDFKVSWPRVGGVRVMRDVFLRASYASVIAGEETARVVSGDPIFLAIDDTQSVDEPGFAMSSADVARAANESHHSLLTDASAFNQISAPPVDSNPLRAVVRSNFLRGARGLVDEPVAERLTAIAPGEDEGVPDLIKNSFFEDAVVRMERTALLVQWATKPDGFENEPPAIEGSMTTDELKAVLPWLLGQSTLPAAGSRFWSDLGSLFQFEQLEELAHDLVGLDLTRLVQANLSSWSARRAYLGLNVPFKAEQVVASTESDLPIDANTGVRADAGDQSATGTDSQMQKPSTPTLPVGWLADSGTIGYAVGPYLVRVSNSGNKLKARPGSSVPRWSSTTALLAPYAVSSVSVSGVERALRVDARESSNVRDDVERVVQSVSDSYFVERVDVSLPAPDDSVGEHERHTVGLDFAGGIAIASSPVQIGPLVQATASILGRVVLDTDLAPSTDGDQGVLES
ncbi:hypothetical protein [Microbacterium sp. HJ5]